MSYHIEKAEKELSEVEELIDAEFCDDGLVFFHLTNAVKYLLKALFEEYKLEIDEEDGIRQMVEKLASRTTLKFPDWIEQIYELEELSVSDGCATSICYDIDMYGDIIDAVFSLKQFVQEQVEQ